MTGRSAGNRRRWRLGAVVLLAAAAVSGCGAPAVQRPPVDLAVPDRWSAPAEDAGPDWWESFPGEAPRALVGEALANNRDLAAAAARLEAAAAEARIAGADLFPQLAANGSAARAKQIFVGLPIPGRSGALSSYSTTYGVSLDLSWELDLWGRLGARRSAAVAEMQAGMADYDGARLSLAGQTLKTHFAAVEAARALELAEAIAAAHDRTVQGIRDRYLEGVRPSVDLRLARVDAANARAAVEQQRIARDRTARALELLLGRYPGALVDVAGDLPAAPAPIPDGLTADLLSRRPDLVAAERRAAAAGRRVSEAKRALLPQIRLTGSVGTTSDSAGDLVDPDFSVWRIAAGVLQPLFQGGRLRAQVNRAGAQEDAAVAAWAQAVLRACGETESALVAERALAAQELAAREAAEQARAALESARSRYETGLDGILTLLSAQRADANAQTGLLRVRRARLEARVDLHLALGGGFRSPAPKGDPSS